jgi:hypothetical protein
MAHVDKWTTKKVYGNENTAAPHVIVDSVRYWTPTKEKVVDFNEVKEYILALKSRGFNIKRVTFDRWNSFDMMEQLRAYGMKCETLSVAKNHFEDMSLAVTEGRIHGPFIPLLIKELLQLRVVGKNKVDHPRTGSKDLADSVCGAIYNAMSLTPKSDNVVSIVSDYYDYDYDDMPEQQENERPEDNDGVIRPPQKREMPPGLKEYLGVEDEEDGPEFQQGPKGYIDNFRII